MASSDGAEPRLKSLRDQQQSSWQHDLRGKPAITSEGPCADRVRGILTRASQIGLSVVNPPVNTSQSFFSSLVPRDRPRRHDNESDEPEVQRGPCMTQEEVRDELGPAVERLLLDWNLGQPIDDYEYESDQKTGVDARQSSSPVTTRTARRNFPQSQPIINSTPVPSLATRFASQPQFSITSSPVPLRPHPFSQMPPSSSMMSSKSTKKKRVGGF